MLFFAVLIAPVVLIKYVSLWPAVVLIGLATACHQGWAANLLTTISDIFPKKAIASVSSIGTMFATVFSMTFSFSIGALLAHWKSIGQIETGYSFIFIYCASVYVVAWIIFNLLAPKLDSINIDD
jgi:MFS transporter, ACS family, hexuronate transporter